MRRLVFGALSFFGTAVPGCAVDECDLGESRCNGSVIQECVQGDGHFGDGGGGTRWSVRATCPEACYDVSANEQVCGGFDAKDERCDGVDAFCDGATRVLCTSGIVTGHESCATACGAHENDRNCFPEFGCKPDGEEKPLVSCFNEAWRIVCQSAKLLEAAPCDTTCFEPQYGFAACARGEDAEPRCTSSVQAFCEGSVRIGCKAGFVVDRTDCSTIASSDGTCHEESGNAGCRGGAGAADGRM